jgi:hypothetical protein
MFLLLLAQAAASVPASPLNLTCYGGGTGKSVELATVNNRASLYGSVGTTPVSGTGYGTSTVMLPHHEEYSDQVQIQLFGDEDKIRLPQSVVPPIHGGSDGWFKLTDVVADAHSIRAKAGINFVNHPKIFIDRVTGAISINGKNGSFSGQCEAVAADAPAKF